MGGIASIATIGLQVTTRRFELAAERIASSSLDPGRSNTDLATQMVAATEAKQSFAANIATLRASEQMFKSLLDVIA